MKAEVRLFPPNSWPALQMFSSTLGARFSRPLHVTCGAAMPEGGQWNGSGTEQPELNLHFATVFYPQGHPVHPSRKQGHCLLWNCLAPAVLQDPHTHPILLQPCHPHVCTRTHRELNIFLAFNILTFDLLVERSPWTDCQGISVCKDRSGFWEAARPGAPEPPQTCPVSSVSSPCAGAAPCTGC